MATRFRKLRTRRTKGRKGLKTRKMRGGRDFQNSVYGAMNVVKGKVGNVTGKLAAVFKGAKNISKKTPNEVMHYMANQVGMAPESRQEFIERMKAMKK